MAMEEYQELAARVRAFGERVLAPTIEEEFREGRSNAQAIPAMAAEGFLGWSLPPRYGGLGHDYRALAVLCEELGRIEILRDHADDLVRLVAEENCLADDVRIAVEATGPPSI